MAKQRKSDDEILQMARELSRYCATGDCENCVFYMLLNRGSACLLYDFDLKEWKDIIKK